MKYSKFMDFLLCDRLMHKLLNQFEKDYSVPVHFVSLTNATGVTHTPPGSFEVIDVHLHPYSSVTSDSFMLQKALTPVNTMSFLKAVYSLKHEERHVQQFQAIVKGDMCDGLTQDDMRTIACEKVSIEGNRMYYHQGYRNMSYDNAQHMLIELDAQRFATRELYEYCKDLYGDEELAKNLVVEMVKNEFGSRGDITGPGRYYLPIFNTKGLTYDKIMDLYDGEVEKIHNGINYRKYVSKGDFEGTIQYEYKKQIKDSDNPMSLDDFCDEVNIYDRAFRWFVSKTDLIEVDLFRFPDYFATSNDVDRFVISASNIMLKEKGDFRLEKELQNTDCLKDMFIITNDSELKSIFENKRPYLSFSFDKYKAAKDLECRLQAVQDSAEEKGLVSDEEVDVEREVK